MAAPAPLQHAGANTNGTPSASLGVAFSTQNVQAGNHILVHVSCPSTVVAGQVTDSAGNTYSLLIESHAENAAWSSAILIAKIVSGGGTKPTVTITPSSSNTMCIAIAEWPGLLDPFAADGTAHVEVTGGVPPSITNPATSAADEVMIAGLWGSSSNQAVTVTTGTLLENQRDGGGNPNQVLAWVDAGAAGSSPVIAFGGGFVTDWECVAVTLKTVVAGRPYQQPFPRLSGLR
jgi:hypothetical protein